MEKRLPIPKDHLSWHGSHWAGEASVICPFCGHEVEFLVTEYPAGRDTPPDGEIRLQNEPCGHFQGWDSDSRAIFSGRQWEIDEYEGSE
jgi:hypothetical protein